MNNRKTMHTGRTLVKVCLCAALVLALGVTVFAAGTKIVRQVFGWGNNLELTVETDENGAETSIVMLHTENMTEPVEIREGRMIFLVNGQGIDITDLVSEEEGYRYEYKDSEGYTHVWIVGLLDREIAHYAYAEYIKDASGAWLTGYSARVNSDADGKTEAVWLERAREELGIPW